MGWGQNIFLGDLKNLGWKLATGFGCENYVYLKPGVKKSTGTVGVDMFNGESALEAYINENGYELSDDDDDDDTSSVVSADAEGRGGDDDGNNGDGDDTGDKVKGKEAPCRRAAHYFCIGLEAVPTSDWYVGKRRGRGGREVYIAGGGDARHRGYGSNVLERERRISACSQERSQAV